MTAKERIKKYLERFSGAYISLELIAFEAKAKEYKALQILSELVENMEVERVKVKVFGKKAAYAYRRAALCEA